MASSTQLKISIITVVYNNANTIKNAIDSILSQTYKNIEYIIVDGNSTDGTIEIIQSYQDQINKFISEPDQGIYDAMNKGINLATGDIIGILNSDDFYSSDSILELINQEFEQKNIDCIYGDLLYIDQDTLTTVRFWKSKPFGKNLFSKGWHPAHPTFFVKRSVYELYGIFNLDFKIAADYEIMLRFLEKYQISSSYIPKVFVQMRLGGESNRNIKNIIQANRESYKAWEVNGLKIHPFLFMMKPISKIFQYIRHR